MHAAVIITLTCLAVYRVTRLLVVDRVTESVRVKVYRRAVLRANPEFKTPEDRRLLFSNIANNLKREPLLAYYVTCPWCVSVWIGGLVVLAEVICMSDVPYPLLLWGASSAVTGFLSGKE